MNGLNKNQDFDDKQSNSGFSNQLYNINSHSID